mmetsp:Transcript_26382/g.69330  ORF Transcript_26382/g.69330 Transcript_26382/m.69330 type:complete len:921 (+) Transcript_26382:99-2861(+)
MAFSSVEIAAAAAAGPNHLPPKAGATTSPTSTSDRGTCLPAPPVQPLHQKPPFVVTKWCSQCWPKRRSKADSPSPECAKSCDAATRAADSVITVLWPPAPIDGQTQTNVVVRNPPADFDFSHMQYLPCGYGRQCKHGLACTRAHSNPPQAEIAYWNWVQPLGAPSRRRRAAAQKNSGKDWSLTSLFECRICGVRMNSAVQLAQHMSGSKHRAQVAAVSLKPQGGVVAPVMLAAGQAAVLPHGTGPFYKTLSAEWSTGGEPCPTAPAMAGLTVSDLTMIPGTDGMKDERSKAMWAVQRTYITAVKAGDTPEVTRLLSEGINVDTCDAGCPALHWAIFMGRVDVAVLLIESGAQQNFRDRDQQTAVHICVHPRHGMMKQMRRESKGSSVIRKYEEDAVRVLTALMQAGWSPDARDSLGRTALHHVAEQGSCTLAYVLLNFKANPALHNSDGYSPTDVATLKAKTEGLTKYVQLRDVLNTALFEAHTSGDQSNPMAIPQSGAHEEPAAGAAASGHATSGPAMTGVVEGGPGSMSTTSSHVTSESANSTYADDDVESAFRPLLAALASLSSTRDAYADRGVEVTQLERRLHEVLSMLGVEFMPYLQHAQRAGIVTLREGANGHLTYVSFAKRLSSLVVRPPDSFSSSGACGSMSLSSMVPSSQSLQWHRGTHGFQGKAAAGLAPTSKDLSDVIQQEQAKTGATSPLDYESIVSGVLDTEDDKTASDIVKISDSLLFDPFASGTHLGPEPLFMGNSPKAPARKPDAIGTHLWQEPLFMRSSPKAPAPKADAISAPPAQLPSLKGAWQGPTCDASWAGLRPYPPGGIPSSLSLGFPTVPKVSANALGGSSTPWPDASTGSAMPRSDSLPTFRTRAPPGLGGVNRAPADSLAAAGGSPAWLNPKTTDATSSLEWLNIAANNNPKHKN